MMDLKYFNEFRQFKVCLFLSNKARQTWIKIYHRISSRLNMGSRFVNF